MSNVIGMDEGKGSLKLTLTLTSLTPKIHAIVDHIPDYIEEKGIALGKTSDQLIEATHQQHNKLFNRSGYFVKVLNSPAHKSRLEKGVHHYNSYHV